MTNQAAQTMPELPEPFDTVRVNEFSLQEAPVFSAGQMRAMYQQGYAVALSQTAGAPDGGPGDCGDMARAWLAVTETLDQVFPQWIESEKVGRECACDAIRFLAERAAAPAASGVHPDALPDGTLSKSTAKRVDALRMAQGEECPHESWDVIGGGRRCVDCGKWLGADATEEATKPPHQDRGEGALVQVALRNLPQYIGKASFSSSVDKQAALNCVEVLAAALTEAKQQGPGEAGRSTSYSREALEIQGAHWRALCRTIDHIAPGLDSGLSGAVEVASAAVRELSAYAARMALDGAAAPQVEAKRQTGEDDLEARARAMFEAQADPLAASWDLQWGPTKEYWRNVARGNLYATTHQPSADAVREVPDGMVLVPREPDISVVHAMREAYRSVRRGGIGGQTLEASFQREYAPELVAYYAMLSAASGDGVDDTKRLDWIARQGGYEFDFGILNDQPGDGDWFVHGMGGSGQGATFRDAIDAAIKEEAGGQDANTDILDTLAFKTENGDAGRGSVTYIALVASGEADHQQNAAQGGGEK